MSDIVLLWWQRRHSNVTQALKTLLTITVTWLLLLKLGLYAQIIGAFASGFLSIIRFGTGYRAQVTTLLCTGAAMVIAACLALSLDQIAWLDNLTFIALVFIAFYMRRFGGRFILPPVFVVLLFIVVELMPKPDLLSLIISIVVATIAALSVVFILFPVRDLRRIENNVLFLMKKTTQLLNCFQQHFSNSNPIESTDFKQSYQRFMKRVQVVITENNSVLNDYILMEKGEEASRLCAYSYRLSKNFIMLFESCESILVAKHQHQEAVTLIAELLHAMQFIIKGLEFKNGRVCFSGLDQLRARYQVFRNYEFAINLDDPESVHIFNFSLGVSRIIETLSAWEQKNAQ